MHASNILTLFSGKLGQICSATFCLQCVGRVHQVNWSQLLDNYVQVVNFPFPTPPEGQALVEAERCLRALSAVDFDTGNLTPIGKAMAVYPISPRHARMILPALHAS
jgi:HrpA-like RNA helicase